MMFFLSVKVVYRLKN